MRLALLAGLLLLLAPAPAHACSVCGCGDPLVDASESVPTMMPLRLALDTEILTASAASDDDPTATESVTQVTIRPAIVYSPIESLNLVLLIPIVHKDWSLDGDAPEKASNTGLGDLDLGVRWFFWRSLNLAAESRQSFGVSAGTSAPTGGNDATVDGMRIDEHAQLGTGSWGPYAGLAYAYHRDPWNVFASVTVRAHSTNSYDYRYGTGVLWSLRGDYRLSDALAVELGFDGRVAKADSDDEGDVANTGGTVLAAAPGIVWNPVARLWLRGRVQIPFVTDLDGRQSVGPTFLLSAQVMVR